MKKIKTSYELVKTSFQIIAKDKGLLAYSLFSLLALLLILGSFGFFGFEHIKALENLINSDNTQSNIIGILILFAFYFITFFVTYFFNTAIITSVYKNIKGEKTNFKNGIKESFNNIWKILSWTFISSTISVILKSLEQKTDSGIAQFIINIIGASWSIATFFAFPIMILEKKGAFKSIKESTKLFKDTWGERAIIAVGTGLFFFLLTLLCIIISVFIAFLNIWAGIIIGISAIIFIILVSGLTDTIIKILIYNYTKTGQIPAGVENPEAIKNVISEKKDKK